VLGIVLSMRGLMSTAPIGDQVAGLPTLWSSIEVFGGILDTRQNTLSRPVTTDGGERYRAAHPVNRQGYW